MLLDLELAMVTNRLIAAAAFALAGSALAGGDFVYSNNTTRLGSVHTLIPAGAADGPEHGDQIVLAGAYRTVTRIDILVRIGNSGVATYNGRVRLYANDGPQRAPGTPPSHSGTRPLITDPGSDLPYQFDVPRVRVPDTFTWTIQLSGRSGQNMSIVGLPHYNPPTVGSATPGYWSHNPSGW